MTYLPTDQFKENLEDALKQVDDGERVVLRTNGKDLAALVSLEDLALLEELENRFDVRAYDEAMKEFKDSGGKSIPLDEICRELGI